MINRVFGAADFGAESRKKDVDLVVTASLCEIDRYEDFLNSGEWDLESVIAAELETFDAFQGHDTVLWLDGKILATIQSRGELGVRVTRTDVEIDETPDRSPAFESAETWADDDDDDEPEVWDYTETSVIRDGRPVTFQMLISSPDCYPEEGDFGPWDSHPHQCLRSGTHRGPLLSHSRWFYTD